MNSWGESPRKFSNGALQSAKVGNYTSVTIVGIVMGSTLILIWQLFNSQEYKVNVEH